MLLLSIFLLFGVTRDSIGLSHSSQSPTLILDSPNPSSPEIKTPGWGEPCKDVCFPSDSVICQNLTCVCDSSYPVYYKEKRQCLQAMMIGDDCVTDAQCQYHDSNTLCQHYSGHFTECICKDSFEIRTVNGFTPPKICFREKTEGNQDIPTFLGFAIILSVMSGLICFVLRLVAKERFARPRGYADAAIPPPLTVSETYAAYANSNRSTPIGGRPRVLRSASSSRRPSYVSLDQQAAGRLLRLSSSTSLGHHRFGNARRLSASSMRSFRSQTGLLIPDIHPEPDHYILYMVRGPSQSVASDTTTSTTCENSSSSPRTPKSTEQILAVYHTVPEHSILDLGKIGPSHTSSTFRTISSEDVFQEEEEDQEIEASAETSLEDKEENQLVDDFNRL